jgi:hypothetical protein
MPIWRLIMLPNKILKIEGRREEKEKGNKERDERRGEEMRWNGIEH